MASLPVRQLDEKLKTLLRVRAAKSGRSVEDEVRTILREAAEETGRSALDLIEPPSLPVDGPKAKSHSVVPAGTKRVLLIVGGGISAYKTLDLIRRLKERGLSVRSLFTTTPHQ